MRIFRNQIGTRVFSLLTGVIFLNMSFFLAEVCMLEITDKQMIENVARLVITGGLEEERDAHSGGNDAPLKIFSLEDNLLLHHSSLYLIAAKMRQESEENYRHANHAKIFSPPPESLPSCS